MKAKKKIGFMTKVLIGLLLGVVAGIVFGEKMSTVGFIGTIFLRLLRVGVVPLILCNIVIAVAGIGDLKKLGRIGIKMFILFMATTLVAAVIGLVFGLIVNPGLGYTMTEVGEVTEQTAPTVSSVILGFFGTDIISSMANAEMLPIISFAILSGIGLIYAPEDDRAKILGGVGYVAKYIMFFLRFVIRFAPIGVFFLISNTIGLYGAEVLGALGKFLGAIIAAALVHMLIIYSLLYYAGTRKNPFKMWKAISPVWVTSFSSCSTAATMPVSITTCKDNLKLDSEVSDLVIPLGANLNMDGNAIWFGVVSVFVAQVCGIDMTATIMVTAVLMGVLMTLGSPGIPGGIFVATTIFLQTLGFPIEFAALLSGVVSVVDPLLTTCNCVGSVIVASVVDKTEGARKNTSAEA